MQIIWSHSWLGHQDNVRSQATTVAAKWNATDKIWDFSTTDVTIPMKQSIVPKYSLGWFLWGSLQDIKCAWFSLEGVIFEFVNFELSQYIFSWNLNEAIWKRLFFWVEYHFVWSKNNPLLMRNMGLKHFLIKQNGILLRKKGSLRWSPSNSTKKIIEKV